MGQVVQLAKRLAPRGSARRAWLVRLREMLAAAPVRLGVRQSEAKLEAAAQQFWNDVETPRQRSDFHLRESPLGESVFEALGAEAVEIFRLFARAVDFPDRELSVLEWGCGGGANLVAFAPLASQLIGVDVNGETLAEAGRQLAAVDRSDFVGVLVDVADPESALRQWREPVDVFLSLYVFETIPSPEYGRRLLRVAAQMLRPGGMALIQIKYETAKATTASKRYSYRRHYASMTTYPIDQFWQIADDEGLQPHLIQLKPVQPLVSDRRYAYFLLTRRDEHGVTAARADAAR